MKRHLAILVTTLMLAASSAGALANAPRGFVTVEG